MKIVILATRIAGTDGVSLETQKWAHIFKREGFHCYYLAGELDRRLSRSMLVEKAHFNHPEFQEINQACFEADTRAPAVTRKIHDIKLLFILSITFK